MKKSVNTLLAIFLLFPSAAYCAATGDAAIPSKATPTTSDKVTIGDASDVNSTTGKLKSKDITLGSLPISTATQTALNGKADTSAFASQAAFSAAWGWTPGGGVSAWSDIQALLTPGGTYVKADGTTGDPSGTLPTATEGQTYQANASGQPVAVNLTELTPTAMNWTSQSALETWLGWTFSGSSFPYPGAGIPLSTGSAWSTSLTLDTDLSSVSSNDDSVPSAKAVKTALSAAGGLTSTLSNAPYSDIACTKDGVYNHTLYKCIDAGSGTGYYTEYIASTAYSNPAPVFYTLSVTDPGNNDSIYSNDSDLSATINCGNGNTACSASIASGSVISGITAIPASGRSFVAWTGDVTGSTASDGTVTVNSNKTCGATFEVYDACSNTSFDSESTVGASTFSVGYSTTVYSAGIVKTSTGTQTVCSIDIYAQRIGTMTGKNIVFERWSTDSSTGALVAKQENIISIEASTVSTTAGWMAIPFGKEVVLNQYDAIVVIADGTVSATNYLRWYYQSTGTMANYRGRGWSDAGVAAATGSGTDMNVKLYAPN